MFQTPRIFGMSSPPRFSLASAKMTMTRTYGRTARLTRRRVSGSASTWERWSSGVAGFQKRSISTAAAKPARAATTSVSS